MKLKSLFETISLFKKPKDSPGFLLWKVSIRWRSQIEAELKNYNLTHPQFVILATLAWLTQNNERVTQKEVSQLSDLDPNTTSQVIKNLEKKKLVTRQQAIDPRAKNPCVTIEGQKLLKKALPGVEKIDAFFFGKLSQHDRKKFVQIALQLAQLTE